MGAKAPKPSVELPAQPGSKARGRTVLAEAGQMLAPVLTSRFDPALEAFDDCPLREFLNAREAIAVRERFFVRNHVPYLTPRRTRTSRLRTNVRVGTTSRPAPQLATVHQF